MELLRRFSSRPVTLAKRDDGNEMISGYAAVYYDGTPETEYELWSGAKERILPGAFDRAIKDKDDCRCLFNHDPNLVLGRSSAGTLRLKADTKGLAYENDPGDTHVARDVIEHLRRGDVSGSSFAFVITDQDWRTENGVDIREIKGVELWDVGPVTYPAYEATTSGIRDLADGVEEARASHAAWKRSQQDESQAGRDARLAAIRKRAVEIDE